jgi:hypothetical protein
VVVVSGYDPTHTPVGSLAGDLPPALVDTYLEKPVSRPEFHDAVARALARTG